MDDSQGDERQPDRGAALTVVLLLIIMTLFAMLLTWVTLQGVRFALLGTADPNTMRTWFAQLAEGGTPLSFPGTARSPRETMGMSAPTRLLAAVRC